MFDEKSKLAGDPCRHLGRALVTALEESFNYPDPSVAPHLMGSK